ncbi:MAG: recombinase family protein [Candidatus Pacebacteria bacterium]|nr:recombinase family protein [Candidatus Paceibacterota bacterium]
MENALIYCRVSTEEQAREGYSLDAQEKFCGRFAEHSGYKIISTYRDEGKSGTTIDRPALQEMLSRCQEDKSIKAVLVQETDRLARGTGIHLAIKAILKKADIKLISVAQPMLDDSPEGNMIDTIIASVNQFQSDLNSRKTKKGMQEKFESGWWPGLAKLGYLNKEVNGEKITVSDPERWHLIRDALKMYLTGNYSAVEIADILYEKGLVARQGKKICNGIMINILKDPFYAGIMNWNKQERKGNHEPMITPAQHKNIITIMDEHNRHACRRRIHNFLLRGFLYCGICGQKYTAEIHKKKNISYYHCVLNGQKHSNEGQNIEAGSLEKMIKEQFKNIQFSEDFIMLVVSKVKLSYEKKKEQINRNKRGLLNQKLALENKKCLAEEKLISGIFDDESFARQRDKIDTEIGKIQEQLENIENQRNIDVDTMGKVLALARNIYGSYTKAPDPIKRLYLALFWDGFWVKDKTIIKAKPTQLIEDLIREKQVITSPNWLRW